VSGEAILSAENGGKPLGGRGSALNPAGGAHSAPRHGRRHRDRCVGYNVPHFWSLWGTNGCKAVPDWG